MKVDPGNIYQMLLEELSSYQYQEGDFTANDIHEATGTPLIKIRATLREKEAAGLIKRVGYGRSGLVYWRPVVQESEKQQGST